MNITYKQILNSVAAFKELQNLRFPPKTALDVYKLGKELDRELETYNELSVKLYKEYKVPEVDGKYKFDELNSSDFSKLTDDLEELLDANAEIKEYHIPMETFERFDLNISPNLVMALEWLIRPPMDEEVPKEKTAKAK